MKTWILTIAILLPTSLFAQAKFKETTALMELMNMKQQQAQMIDLIVNGQVSANPSLKLVEKEYRALMNKTLGWESIKNDILKLWESKFTQAEIGQLVEFYKSPLGQKNLQMMPELMQAGAKIGEQRMISSQPEIEKLNKLLEQRMKKQK